MGIISLEGIEFYAYHGVYEEENKTGNPFIVDLEVHYDFESKTLHDDIHETVDYEELYKIVDLEMRKTSKLIETVAQKMLITIFETFKDLQKVKVSISKLNPPIAGKCKYSKVSINLDRNTYLEKVKPRPSSVCS